MSDYRRPQLPGSSIFFTVTVADRSSDLLVQEIDRLRRAVQQTRRERPFAIDAWVVLPDHMHCIWTLPANDHDFATRWRLIKARFSMGLPKGRLRSSHISRAERGVWQRRFWEHHIRDHEDWVSHMRYCELNPVKHGLVENPEDWPFSSFNR